MSLATRLEQAIREREAATHTGEFCIKREISTQMLVDNESAILAALKFQEAVERHKVGIDPRTDGDWEAIGPDGWAKASTPAAAVASLVAELEKTK